MLQSRILRMFMFASFLGLTVATLLLLHLRSKDREMLQDLTRSNAELQSQLEDRDRSMKDLQGSTRQLQTATQALKAPTETGAVVETSTALELARRLEATASIQQQTLELVQKLGKRMGAPETERSPEQIKAQVAGLEQAREEIRVKLADAKKKVADLLNTLAVPEEVAVLDYSRAMNMPSLQRYWPFFEAARERENMVIVAERLNLRIIQEQIEAHTR